MNGRGMESNRVDEPGRFLRPSTILGLSAVAGLLAGLPVTGLLCMPGHGFDLEALLNVVGGQWRLTPAGRITLPASMLAAALVCAALLSRITNDPHAKVARGMERTRVDPYASAMGHGRSVDRVGRRRAESMAARLVQGWDPEHMAPGFRLGRNVVDGGEVWSSWEDMCTVFAGPRTGKSLCYAIPAVLMAPGPVLATSNKGDIIDATMPVRRRLHNGRIWVFDPECIADPDRGRAPWVWDLVAGIHTMGDAKRIADCWRYASGQPQSGGDDFFPGTAAQQLADYLFAAHLGHRTVADVFTWASNERDSTPADILAKDPRYSAIASRVSSVIGLTAETRSGVFGSLQTMVSFLADPDVIDWILPREGDGTPAGRPVFDPASFAVSDDTLYLLSAQGRPSTALTASLTAVSAFTAFNLAQSRYASNNRRLPVPLCMVLDEAANICRWPELADVYSYFGSAGVPIMTIWQNPDQGRAAFGETNFGSLFNNSNILVFLGGIKDAKWLGDISHLVGQREVIRSSASTDDHGMRNLSRSVQTEDILPISRLAEWPVGRALVLASQSRAQIAATQPWTDEAQWVSIVQGTA